MISWFQFVSRESGTTNSHEKNEDTKEEEASQVVT